MITKSRRILRRVRQYFRAIEGLGAFKCILDELLNREVVRPIVISGTKLWVRTNTPDLLVAIAGLYELEYENVRCTDPKTIIDAGANIGTSSLFFSKKFPNSKIYAIEPENGNFEMLIRNTRNNLNVVAVKAAIWGQVDRRVIQNRETGHWGYTISNTENAVESTGQEIDCITINGLMDEYHIDNIDLLKMDIEGGEKDVLENSASWINSVDIITVELHDRICMGCDRAFYLATKNYKVFEKHGEKVTAYRE